MRTITRHPLPRSRHPMEETQSGIALVPLVVIVAISTLVSLLLFIFISVNRLETKINELVPSLVLAVQQDTAGAKSLLVAPQVALDLQSLETTAQVTPSPAAPIITLTHAPLRLAAALIKRQNSAPPADMEIRANGIQVRSPVDLNVFITCHGRGCQQVFVNLSLKSTRISL